jgi:hypothetical protein
MTLPARLSPIAEFPAGSFLENIVVRPDGSILVTELLQKRVWYLPRPSDAEPVEPVLVCAFEELASGILEAEHDIFYVSTTNAYTTGESFLHRLDLRAWRPGQEASVETVLAWEDAACGLNGSCLLAPGIALLADSVAGVIWRVNLPRGGAAPTRRIWLADETMRPDPPPPNAWPKPGVNGVRFAAGTNHLYYTSTAKQLFMRVAVDPVTGEPAGSPEVVAEGMLGDDFCLDEDLGFAYVTTHRENTLLRIPLRPGAEGEIVAGEPFDEMLTGPSSCAWRNGPETVGRVAYVTTDGGFVSPPRGGVGPARVVELVLAPAGGGA